MPTCTECGDTGIVEVLTGEYRGWNGVIEPIYEERPCEYCDGEEWDGDIAYADW